MEKSGSSAALAVLAACVIFLIAAARPEVIASLSGLLDAIDVQTMRRANQMVDVEGRSVAEAAAYLAQSLRAGSR